MPGDPSSAAFPVAAALILGKSEVRIEDVLVNPLRLGFFETMLEMGGKIAYEERRDPIGEPIADLVVKASKLQGAAPPARRAPAMIDEFPILAVVAAFAEGETRIVGAAELRVKESDRITHDGRWLARLWRRCGGTGGRARCARARAEERARRRARSARLGDHRVAMSFLVLGMASKEPVIVDDADMIATSFPGFADCMRSLGGDIEAV